MAEWHVGLHEYLSREVDKVQKKHDKGLAVTDDILRLGAYCYGLYCDFVSNGRGVEFSDEVHDSHPMGPFEPEFFFHLDSIVDFMRATKDIFQRPA